MSGLTEYGAAAIASGTALPQTLYAKLHLADPGVNGTANAATESSREEVVLEAGDPHDRQNDDSVLWENVVATEDVSYVSLWDAATGGNPWLVGPVSPILSLTSGGDGEILVGKIRITIARHS